MFLSPSISRCFFFIVLQLLVALQVECDECPVEEATFDTDQAPQQDATVLVATKALQDYLDLQDDQFAHRKVWRQITRVDLSALHDEKQSDDLFHQVVKLLTENQPVVLTGLVNLTGGDIADETSTFWQSIRGILQKWRRESLDHRYADYWRGGGLGSCESQNYSASRWEWPWSDKLHFWLKDCGAFGSFGTKDSVNTIEQALESTGGPGRFLHFDSVCEHAFSAQVMGSKLYWIQGPERDLDERGLRQSIASFYAENKKKSIAAPSNSTPRMRDYTTILSPGELVLYNLWMPHIGLPVRGHAWSFNGHFRLIGEDRWNPSAAVAQPVHLRDLCWMRQEVSNFETEDYPQVQPWDAEWTSMAAELKQYHRGGKQWDKVVHRWTHIWRNRVCSQRNGQPKADLGSYRDARCHELILQPRFDD